MRPRNAGIYARISSDVDDNGLGVNRQVSDCETEAERRGWQVADRYVDNDISATRTRVRPQYQRLLADIRAGHISALIVWDVDRLTRNPRELEDIIDLADAHDLSLASIGGEIDLATPQGRMTARIKGSVARHEAEQMSRRIKRRIDQKAASGQPHGAVAFGYRRVDVLDEAGHRVGRRDELHPEEAAIVREMADRMLRGESMRTIASDLNRRAVPSPRSAHTWSSTTVRQMVLRERNAGLRRHRGEVVGVGDWPPIFDRQTFDRLLALVSDPARRSSRGSARRHLLTGIARCGRDACDGTMVVNCGRLTGSGKRQPPAYVCASCHRVRRKQFDVDRTVTAAIVGRLEASPRTLAAAAAGDLDMVSNAQTEVNAIESRLLIAADKFAEGEWTAAQLQRITDQLRPKLADARSRLALAQPSALLSHLIGRDASARWHDLPLDSQREVIETLAIVTILPTGSGQRFDPESVQVELV